MAPDAAHRSTDTCEDDRGTHRLGLGPMRVLLAPGAFPGALTAAQAGEAMASGWVLGAPHDQVDLLPLSDGGSGLVDVLSAALDGDQVVVTVGDPLGRPVPATILRVPAESGATAYLDGTAAVGGHLVDAADHDAGHTTSHGLGELVQRAMELDVRRIVIGLGAGVAFDGGAGLLGALGAGPAEELTRGGLALGDLTSLDAESLGAARAALDGVELVLLTDEDLPLLGFHGVHAVRAGTSPDGVAATPTARGQALEAAVGHFAHLATRAHGGTDLLTGKPRRFDQEPGAGAGGGAGHGLLLLGARRVPGAGTVADLVGLSAALAAHDLVVTGLGRFDWEAARGGIVPVVAERAGAVPVPSVVVAAESLVGRRESMSLGLSGSYALTQSPEDRERWLADPVTVLEQRMARLARTWSPQR